MRVLLYLATGVAVAFASRKSGWGFWDWFYVVLFWWLYIAIRLFWGVVLGIDSAVQHARQMLSGASGDTGSGSGGDSGEDSGGTGRRWWNGLGDD